MRPKGKFFLSLTLACSCLAFSSCSSEQGVSSNAPSSTSKLSTSVGTNGQLIAIKSDNVRAAGYDQASKVMTVQFNNGSLYEYYGVPTDLWTEFVDAQPHPWSQVGYPRLVRAGIPYERIG